ncbi:LOW QUALITY PROTEIN: oogenesin-2-like [Acomys russatus]|uniref:LOW QUALITY PROTEIN: oogenesin-2-like n=1 Tax=Acomys russatus TaxID=60746 RepID=UPI0021E2BDCE|nr:LOW QUALITY PROTEIN: oogenesin-2-like [Acomys russatus]
MGVQIPPTLLTLARQALLRDEALAISHVENLPVELFPALFKEAFTGRHTKITTAMVAAWPFPCLPVGALMTTPDLETFQAVLAGVDMRLKRKFQPRCLMTPLETLSITYCQISQSDLDGISQCQKLFQLRHLDLSGVVLLDLDLTPLCVLLENTAHTLQSLDLKGCRMTDPQLADLIPALSQCCQLTRVGFYDNYFSMPILMDFLQHSAKLSKMNEERYPAPLECYYMFDVSIERFTQLCAQLMDTLKAIRQPKTLSFGTIMCHLCCKRLLYPEQFGCSCWQ